MDYNILITFLQEKQYLTDLEADIIIRLHKVIRPRVT